MCFSALARAKGDGEGGEAGEEGALGGKNWETEGEEERDLENKRGERTYREERKWGRQGW